MYEPRDHDRGKSATVAATADGFEALYKEHGGPAMVTSRDFNAGCVESRIRRDPADRHVISVESARAPEHHGDERESDKLASGTPRASAISRSTTDTRRP